MISIEWNDDSLKEYFNKFWFKFSCCHDFNGFIVANNFWLQNKRVHGTFHDFMRLLEGFDFDRDQLQIEYDTAFATLQMAQKWDDIWKVKDIFKKLKFDITIDGRTTDEERKLKDIVLEIEDPLLDVIFPPNHFSDRSNVNTAKRYRLSKFIDIPRIETKFKNNVGKYFVINEKDFFAVPKSDENLEIVKKYYEKNRL